MKIGSYWLKQSKLISWHKNPKISYKKKKLNFYEWYPDGRLNIFYNCVTKNLYSGLKNKIAIHTVDKKKQFKSYTYEEINNKVTNFSNILNTTVKKNLSSCKIMIHASASLDSSIAMLTCSKLGIHFSVIFEDLASEAILKRILLLQPDIFISRFSKKKFINSILKNNTIKTRTKFIFFEDINFNKNKRNVNKKIKYFKSSKDLFTLFTSGSTGVPKGVVHSSGGYFVYAKYTCINQFGMNKNSVVLTASDAGWINGHTYALFGPLSFGATTILLESPMLLLDYNLLKKILKLKVTILYLPVTLIRLMKALFKKIKMQNRHLNTIGSMGEPLAPSIAEWYSSCFTNKKKAVVNTYFQTETGGIIASPKYNEKTSSSPHGSVGKIISKNIIHEKLYKDKKREIKLKTIWPGCMKRVLNGIKEWKKYWDDNNNFRLFDLATIKDKNIFIHGRIDDVINVRGHRVGSEEIESVVLQIKEVSECCAISIKDELEGNVIYLFVVTKNKNVNDLVINKLQSNFGTFAIPKKIYNLSELPKTRSGKILRRLLRTILNHPKTDNYGDLSTIFNKKIVYEIKNKILENEQNRYK